MRIALCDYSGHPFQVQLSRELARRAHDVLHLHFAEFQTPKGKLELEPGDPSTLEIAGICLGRPFAKHSFLKRRFQEVKIGKQFAARTEDFNPDIVVGSNMPLDALERLTRRCKELHRPFVFWIQDIYSVAINDILKKKIGLPGRLVGWYYHGVEARALERSTAIVVIADDFATALERDFGVSGKKIHVVHNWSPVDEITPRPKSNRWSWLHGLDCTDVVLYTGTLGMKHDPNQILALADALRSRPQTALIVTSEGPGADWLATRAQQCGLHNLRVLPFQAFEVYPEVLGTADVLIAILEANAGGFSVPSKILSYLCAGRAIVLSAPSENLAARIVVEFWRWSHRASR